MIDTNDNKDLSSDNEDTDLLVANEEDDLGEYYYDDKKARKPKGKKTKKMKVFYDK